MQNVTKFILILGFLFSTSLLAQEQGDYRTKDSGDWSNAQIWEQFNGSSWVAIGTPPTGSETITVLEADSEFISPLEIP